jgi:hypothetical protein
MPKMGKELTAKAGLASALFSRVRLRVLSILIGNPGHKFHTAEIIGIARSGFGAVQRELRKLADVGILNTETVGNRKFYQANRQSPIFKELHGYRPNRQRYIVFQVLAHTLGMRPEHWRVLDKCHSARNLAEYEGSFEVNIQLLSDLLTITDAARRMVEKLGPVPKRK